MRKDLQVYIDKIPEIVSDALPKLVDKGYNLWDLDEDKLNMVLDCECLFGQLEGSYGDSTRMSLIDDCPIGYFERPLNYLGTITYARFGVSKMEGDQFGILYYKTLTIEYKKQIKQWKKNKKLHKPKEIINNINHNETVKENGPEVDVRMKVLLEADSNQRDMIEVKKTIGKESFSQSDL